MLIKHQNRNACRVNSQPHLIVIRAVGGLFHRGVLLFIAHLHTHHRVHIEAYQLPSLDHRDADLIGDREQEHKGPKRNGTIRTQLLPRGTFRCTTII